MVLGALLETLVGLPGELLSTSIELSLSLLVCIAFLFATMSIIALLIILVSLILASLYKISLEKPKVDAVDQVLGPNCSVVYAHRAGALDAPENTLAAIRLAKTNKAFGVELDLSFTKDGVAIAFHDDDLERTTDGRGALCDHTWDEVSALDASINHIYHDRFQKERVPKMDDAIHEALRLGLHIIIDIKAYDKQVVTYLVSLFDRTPELYEKALVASFFPQVIYSLRSERPKMVAALIWRPFYLSHKNTEATKPRFRDSPLRQWAAELLDPLLGLAIHKFLWHVTGCSAVLIVKDCICPHYLRQWRDRDIRVLSWTPNNPVEKDYLISLGIALELVSNFVRPRGTQKYWIGPLFSDTESISEYDDYPYLLMGRVSSMSFAPVFYCCAYESFKPRDELVGVTPQTEADEDATEFGNNSGASSK